MTKVGHSCLLFVVWLALSLVVGLFVGEWNGTNIPKVRKVEKEGKEEITPPSPETRVPFAGKCS
ncbi:MAG TPA: hypothetical protein DCE56_36900 [Cyanobacteria bacterium UBA8553]|nr:hypothetical protein [Cyanobacteria bacterium UBA8553]